MAMMVKCSNNLVGPIRKHETVVSHGQPSLMMANNYQLCIRIQSWHKRHHHQTNNKIHHFSFHHGIMADHNSPPVSSVSSDGSGKQTFFSAAHDLRLRLEDMAHVVDNPEVATAAGDETVDMASMVEVDIDDGPVKTGLLISRTGFHHDADSDGC